ncbi:MAG: MBOAT family protein [Leptospiraceae bacterium]|nr:MBOAT family protein [Leptospiraceae bacterium]MCK6382625.1 MBOAT family protein [Leptospiraceae bacterium]NUM41886.1 MBOAT family protein [Leptospiraceae bacterium]
MLFNSIPFLFFFVIVYLFYWNIPSRFRFNFLIVAGLFFYGFFSFPFLIHFLVVISINYFLYRKIRNKESDQYVKIAVVFNLINLGFFKYFYFFTTFIGDVIGSELLKKAPDWISITLPLAISFYSFQMIAAAVDAHRDASGETIGVRDYFLFVMFFPVLIAGPIMRTTDFLPNLSKNIEPDRGQIYRACFLLMSGLIKKILIADPIAGRISPVFANPSEYDNFSLFMSGIFYTLQVYSDFSGLTDMARSIALFLGFEIPENFYAPFFSTSGRELWRRWHATLSNWLRDYIYFPLGGNRKGEFRSHINLFITMVLGGLWHGADYTFVAWGAYWGALLAIERIFVDKLKISILPGNLFTKVLQSLLIFVLFSISALMFRSNSASLMVDLFAGIFTNDVGFLSQSIASANGGWLVSGMSLVGGGDVFQMNSLKNLESFVYMYIMFLIFHYFQYKPESLNKFKKYSFVLSLVLGIITIFMITTLSQDGDAFIYYRF